MKWLSIIAFWFGGSSKFGGQSHFWLIIGGIITMAVLGAITTVIWLKHKKKST